MKKNAFFKLASPPVVAFALPCLWSCSTGVGYLRSPGSLASQEAFLSPNPGGRSNQVDWSSGPCQDFLDYSLNHRFGDKEPLFKTDGMVVIKDGQNLFEFYDGDESYGGDPKTGLYLRDTPHSLWSASKSVTSTLLARAIHEGAVLPNGNPIDVETPLNQVFSAQSVYGFSPLLIPPNAPPSEILKLPKRDDGNTYAGFYYDIKLKHLLSMGANFKWNEGYEDDLSESTFLPMLYLKNGNSDMLSFAIRMPMQIEGPGKRFNYSGGNTIMLSAVLRSAYGEGQYSTLPWTLLFDRLGMKGAIFERDGKGTFIGNSYVYLRPLDMAALGLLYLQDGLWEGERLIDHRWIEDAQKLSPAEINPNTPYPYIVEEGVYGSRALWLNQKVQKHCAEFPNSPSDMYFAAGHYGQLIMILPRQNMVIARTGHDDAYWAKIDGMVSKAIACFAPERLNPAETPGGQTPACQEGK